MKINQKGLGLPIVFLAIVVIFLFVYTATNNTSLFKRFSDSKQVSSVSPSPTPEAAQIIDNPNPNKPGYKLYTNNEGHYQISYPENWARNTVYNYYDPHDDLTVTNLTDQTPVFGFLDGQIELSVGHLSESADNSKFIFDKFDQDTQNSVGAGSDNKVNGNLTKIGNFEIAGKTGIKFTYTENYEGATYGLIQHFKANDTIYFINFFTPDKPTMDKYHEQITEVINSFKLLPN